MDKIISDEFFGEDDKDFEFLEGLEDEEQEVSIEQSLRSKYSANYVNFMKNLLKKYERAYGNGRIPSAEEQKNLAEMASTLESMEKTENEILKADDVLKKLKAKYLNLDKELEK